MIIPFVNMETDPSLRYHTTHLLHQKMQDSHFPGLPIRQPFPYEC
jgi:hypothetical protein